jgi:hypothetical protein
MLSIYVTKVTHIVTKADARKIAILDTVAGSGDVKKEFLSEEQFAALGLADKDVSDVSKGEFVELGAVYDGRGKLVEVEEV